MAPSSARPRATDAASHQTLRSGCTDASCLFLLVLSIAIVAGLAQATRGGEEGPGAGSVRGRVEGILSDQQMPLRERIQQIDRIEGTLSPEDARATASQLEDLRGETMLAVARLMARCGARQQALTVMSRVAADHEAPADQWAPAVSFLSSAREDEAGPALRAAVKILLDRLEPTRGEGDLLEVLGQKNLLRRGPLVWRRQTEAVAERLCALLKHDSPKVQGAAAEALMLSLPIELVPSRALVATASRIDMVDDGTAKAWNELLSTAIGVGPQTEDMAGIRVFWKDWAKKAGEDFGLVDHALARAESSSDLFQAERARLAVQIVTAAQGLAPADRARTWHRLRSILESGDAPQRDRVSVWLRPLVLIGAQDKSDNLQQEALSLLLGLSRSEDPEVRKWALWQFGDLPAAMRPGSAGRDHLNRVIADTQALPGERVHAAWSFRRAAAKERRVAERLIALGEALQHLPHSRVKAAERITFIGMVSAALSEASGKPLDSTDPSGWRKALKNWLAKLPEHAEPVPEARRRIEPRPTPPAPPLSRRVAPRRTPPADTPSGATSLGTARGSPPPLAAPVPAGRARPWLVPAVLLVALCGAALAYWLLLANRRAGKR